MFVRRKLFLAFTTAPAAVLLQGLAAAQQPGSRVARLGVLTTEPGPVYAAFLRALAERGLVESSTLLVEPRFHRGAQDRLPALAAELVQARVDAIAAVGGVVVRALRQATSEIPIVFAVVVEPVAARLVEDAQRPGGNVTGVTSFDPGQPHRQVQLLKQAVPGLARLAVLHEEGLLDLLPDAYRAAAEAEGLRLQVVRLRGPEPDLDAAFAALSEARAQAVIGLEVPLIDLMSRRIAERAVAARLPCLFSLSWAGRGEMLAYGTSLAGATVQMAGMVERVLRGARPGDLPVEVVTRHQLVVNQRVARAVGVTISPEVLARADRVVE